MRMVVSQGVRSANELFQHIQNVSCGEQVVILIGQRNYSAKINQIHLTDSMGGLSAEIKLVLNLEDKVTKPKKNRAKPTKKKGKKR